MYNTNLHIAFIGYISRTMWDSYFETLPNGVLTASQYAIYPALCGIVILRLIKILFNTHCLYISRTMWDSYFETTIDIDIIDINSYISRTMWDSYFETLNRFVVFCVFVKIYIPHYVG